MSKIISGSAPRLVFAIVDGTTGAAITDAVAADISTAKYQTIGPSGQRSALSADVGTLTAVASTASVIAGSFGAIDSSQGLYFIDFPALAALDSAHSVQAVIELVSGDNVALPVVHEIDAKVSTRATPANVTTALEDMELDKALIAQGAERAVNVDVNHRVHSHVYDMQANTITASALAADAGAEIAALVWSAATRSLTDKTGFALSATGLDLVTAWTTDITGSLSGNVGGIAGTIQTLDALDTAQDTQHGTTQDRLGYTLAALAGACADAGTAAETYAITIGVDTYTIDHTGLDATGNRGTAVLSKS
jgi:hypothetical protein